MSKLDVLNCVVTVFILRDTILGNFCLEVSIPGEILNSGGLKFV